MDEKEKIPIVMVTEDEPLRVVENRSPPMSEKVWKGWAFNYKGMFVQQHHNSIPLLSDFRPSDTGRGAPPIPVVLMTEEQYDDLLVDSNQRPFVHGLKRGRDEASAAIREAIEEVRGYHYHPSLFDRLIAAYERKMKEQG
jgi:hypothetical protein